MKLGAIVHLFLYCVLYFCNVFIGIFFLKENINHGNPYFFFVPL